MDIIRNGETVGESTIKSITIDGHTYRPDRPYKNYSTNGIRMLLSSAITLEEYEKAAQLRDELHEREETFEVDNLPSDTSISRSFSLDASF